MASAKQLNDDAEAPLDCASADVVHALYQQLGRAALSKVLRVVGRQEVAQEVVQDAFVKLWTTKMQFASARIAYAWVYRVCHNAAIDYLRSPRYRREDGADAAAEPADAAASSFDKAQLAEMIRALPEAEARVLVYQVVDGMTQDEIAEHLGVSRKTVQRLLIKVEALLQQQRMTYAAH